MVVLLTGATGVLGLHLVRRLTDEGHAVHVLTRRPFLADRLLPETVTIHEWHPRWEPVPPPCLDGVDAIVHLMGAPLADQGAKRRKTTGETPRQRAAQRIAEAVRGRPIRLIFISAATAPETEPTAPAFAEHVIDGTDDVAIVRLGLLAAPSASLQKLVRLAGLGLVPNLRNSRFAAIDPVDAAGLISGLIERRDLRGCFIGAAPQPVEGRALETALKQIAGLPRTMPLPGRYLEPRLDCFWQVLQAPVPPHPERLLAAGARFETPDPTALLELAVAELASREPRLSARLAEAARDVASVVSRPKRTKPDGPNPS